NTFFMFKVNGIEFQKPIRFVFTKKLEFYFFCVRTLLTISKSGFYKTQTGRGDVIEKVFTDKTFRTVSKCFPGRRIVVTDFTIKINDKNNVRAILYYRFIKRALLNVLL